MSQLDTGAVCSMGIGKNVWETKLSVFICLPKKYPHLGNVPEHKEAQNIKQSIKEKETKFD